MTIMARNIELIHTEHFTCGNISISKEETPDATWYFCKLTFFNGLPAREKSYKTLKYAMMCMLAWTKYCAVKDVVDRIKYKNIIPKEF